MIVAALIVDSRLEVVVSDIARQVGNVIKNKRAVLNPEIQKTIIMAHTWLRGLYSNGHDEIGWVNKTNFANNQKGTISDSFIYAIGNKVFVFLVIARIWKNHTRRNGRVIRTTLKSSLKRRKKFLNVHIQRNVAKNFICLGVVKQNGPPFMAVCLDVPSDDVFVISKRDVNR